MIRRRLLPIALAAGMVLPAALWARAVASDPSPGPGNLPAAPPGVSAAPLQGGVGAGEPGAEPLRLTLTDAIARGLEHNLAALLATEGVRAATGARWVALGGVLPSLEAELLAARQKISLEEFGFPSPPGESPLIGPFDVVRGQISLSAALLDASAINRARAGGERLAAARFSLQDARDLVVSACAGLYLQAVTAASRVEAAKAQVATAEALAQRAQDMRQAGTVAGIEVVRANVQLAAQRLRLIQAGVELARGRLALARALGVPLAQPLDLVDPMPFNDLAGIPPEEALAQALAARPDLKSAEAELRAAEDERRAAAGRALPSLHLNADVALVGPSVDTTKTTYAALAAVRIPLFEGGRIHGETVRRLAEVEQQRARIADLRARIEYEVRSALLDLAAAAQQVQVASGARDLAAQQLAQAEDRFAAGVASNIEVVQAQQALAEATDSYISSLLAHNLAKLSLARAVGAAERQAGNGGGR